AQHLGGVEIDGQFKFGCLSDRQLGGIFTLENPSGVNAGQAVAVQKIRSVAHQTASRRKGTILIDRGHDVVSGQGGQLVDAANEDWAHADHEPGPSQTVYISYASIKFACGPGSEDM